MPRYFLCMIFQNYRQSLTFQLSLDLADRECNQQSCAHCSPGFNVNAIIDRAAMRLATGPPSIRY